MIFLAGLFAELGYGQGGLEVGEARARSLKVRAKSQPLLGAGVFGAGRFIFRLGFSLGLYLLVEGTDCGTVPKPRI